VLKVVVTRYYCHNAVTPWSPHLLTGFDARGSSIQHVHKNPDKLLRHNLGWKKVLLRYLKGAVAPIYIL